MNTPFYQLVKTMGRQIEKKAIIDEIDAGDIPIVMLSQKYYDIYFVIKAPVYSTTRVLYFKDLPQKIQTSMMSIRQYLTEVGQKTLPLSVTVPTHIRGEVYCWDAFQWNFDRLRIARGMHPRARIPEEDKKDLKLFKGNDKNYNHYHAGRNSLVSINGLFHYFDYDATGWLIHHGGDTITRRPNNSHINILDFSQVGELDTIRITREMIQPLKSGIALKEGFYIDTKRNLLGKTVGVVIGGYFHLLDHTYKRISERRIRINFNNIRWESLYFQMKRLIDTSSFPITDFENDRTLGFELYHDETLLRLMELPQSFVVVINNPYVVVNEERVGHIGIPGRYETGIKPVYPLRIGEGRYPAYKVSKNWDKWCLSVDDNICPRQVRYQDESDDFHVIHDRIYPIFGEDYADAHFIRIYSDRTLNTRIIDPYFDPLSKTNLNLFPFISRMSLDNFTFRETGRSEYYYPPKLVDEDLNSHYWLPQPLPMEQYQLEKERKIQEKLEEGEEVAEESEYNDELLP